MEEIKFDIETKELSRELVAEGYTKRVDCKNYWDSHGTKYWEGITSYPLEQDRKFELYRVIREYNFKYTGPYPAEFLFLYIDGQQLDVGEIVEFRELKTKLKLTCCIGAG